MLFQVFTSVRSPCALAGIHTQLTLRCLLQRRYCGSVGNLQETSRIPVALSIYNYARDSPSGSIHESNKQKVRHSTPSSVGQDYSFLNSYTIPHSSVLFRCSIRAPRTWEAKPLRVKILSRAYSTDRSKSDADSLVTQEPPPKELRTHLEAFFSEYPEFEYDPTKPCTDEFKRLTKGWEKKSEEFQKARKGMNEALTEQFNAIYGKDPSDVAAWRNLCSVLDLAEIPTEKSACKKLIKSLYINIVDLVDQPVTNVRVGYFNTEQDLARYTRKHKRFYSLQAAKAGGLLKSLLRFIEQPRRKSLSQPKLRKA